MIIPVTATWSKNRPMLSWYGTLNGDSWLHDNQNNKTGLMADLTRLDNSFKNRARALDRVLRITQEIQASLNEICGQSSDRE